MQVFIYGKKSATLYVLLSVDDFVFRTERTSFDASYLKHIIFIFICFLN